jgi:hypothetical protein
MMAEKTPGMALRELEQAQAALRKARALLKQDREDPGVLEAVFEQGWVSLSQAYRLMAGIPQAAIDHEVLTKQLAVARYATALLVRLRRLKRREGMGSAAIAEDDDEFSNEDAEE